MNNYRVLAIAKTKHGTTQYAVIDDDYQEVVAIVKVNGGLAFSIKLLEETLTEAKAIIEYIKEMERKHLL